MCDVDLDDFVVTVDKETADLLKSNSTLIPTNIELYFRSRICFKI